MEDPSLIFPLSTLKQVGLWTGRGPRQPLHTAVEQPRYLSGVPCGLQGPLGQEPCSLLLLWSLAQSLAHKGSIGICRINQSIKWWDPNLVGVEKMSRHELGSVFLFPSFGMVLVLESHQSVHAWEATVIFSSSLIFLRLVPSALLPCFRLSRHLPCMLLPYQTHESFEDSNTFLCFMHH